MLVNIALCWHATAQANQDLVQDLELWTPVSVDVPLSDHWRSTMEVQPRFDDNISRISVIRLRPSVTYSPSSKVSLTGGYLWSPDFPANSSEQRIWEQAVYNHPWGKLKLNHQVRLEQRFLEGANETAHRARYLVRLLYPLDKKGRWAWVNSNEILVNLNRTNELPGGFNQNRLFTGIRRTYKNNAFTEAGYLLQFVDGQAPSGNQLNHVLVVRFSLPLPGLTKSKDPDQPRRRLPADIEPINPL